MSLFCVCRTGSHFIVFTYILHKFHMDQMELSREINKKLVNEICKCVNVDKKHVFMSKVPLDMSFVFAIQNYLRGQEKRTYSIIREILA